MLDVSKNLVVGSDFLPHSAVSLDTYWAQPEAVKLELVHAYGCVDFQIFSDQTPIALPCCHQHDDRFHAKKIHFVSYARYSLGTFQVTNLVLHTYKIYLICGGLWEHGKHK